jgi:hypothetical protein
VNGTVRGKCHTGHRVQFREGRGKVIGDNIVLPNSHGRFQPVATAENWDGGVVG